MQGKNAWWKIRTRRNHFPCTSNQLDCKKMGKGLELTKIYTDCRELCYKYRELTSFKPIHWDNPCSLNCLEYYCTKHFFHVVQFASIEGRFSFKTNCVASVESETLNNELSRIRQGIHSDDGWFGDSLWWRSKAETSVTIFFYAGLFTLSTYSW